jgi:putative FmdB family regulatory protein
MPIYEYDCPACGRSFSKLYRSQSAAAAPPACPGCGATDVRRALSRFQVHQTLKTKIERLDPRYEKELEWADRFNKQTDPLSRLNLDFNPPSA